MYEDVVSQMVLSGKWTGLECADVRRCGESDGVIRKVDGIGVR